MSTITTSPAQAAAPPVPADLLARFAKLEMSAVSREEMAVQFSSAAAVVEMQARIDALEKTIAMQGNTRVELSAGKSTAAVTSSVADLGQKMLSLESCIKALEEKVKLQAKRSDQIIKEQRQRAVAQGGDKAATECLQCN